MTVNWSLQHKRDTAANWTAGNPTLLAGQLGIETDGLTTTPKFKIGDGSTAWNTLPYISGGTAQTLQGVLTNGNSSGNLSAKFGTGYIYWGGSNQTHIQYANTGLEIHNTTANKLLALTDSGYFKVDAVQYMPNLTASRDLYIDSNGYIITVTDTEETQSITGTTMTLSNTPKFIYGVYMNGQRLTLTTDYSILANVITFVSTLAADSITVVYKY